MRREDHLKIDFHALRVLLAVHENGSISQAADRLEMSQSSVSYVVDRLRAVFDDPLFVRMGRSIRPTERCIDIAARARHLLRGYEEMVVPATFDPTASTDTFVLSCNFYERSILLPPLVHRLQRLAPGVRLKIVSADARGMRQLEEDACDVVVSPLQPATSGIWSERLLAERYACFVSHDSPWTRHKIDLQSYVAARHINVRPFLNWRPYFHTALDALGVSIEAHIEVSSFGEIDRVIEGTELVLTATEGFARLFSPRITCVEAPFDCAFAVHMSWAGRTHRSPAHLWFRDQIRQVARSLAAPRALKPALSPASDPQTAARAPGSS